MLVPVGLTIAESTPLELLERWRCVSPGGNHDDLECAGVIDLEAAEARERIAERVGLVGTFQRCSRAEVRGGQPHKAAGRWPSWF